MFFERFIPEVRSLISLPAGADHMNLLTYSIFTIAGSALWNVLLIGLGAALGTQYALIARYSQHLNYAVHIDIGVAIVFLIIKRVRRRTPKGKSAPRTEE